MNASGSGSPRGQEHDLWSSRLPSTVAAPVEARHVFTQARSEGQSVGKKYTSLGPDGCNAKRKWLLRVNSSGLIASFADSSTQFKFKLSFTHRLHHSTAHIQTTATRQNCRAIGTRHLALALASLALAAASQKGKSNRYTNTMRGMHRPFATAAVRVAAGSVVVDEHNVLQDDGPIEPCVSNL